MAVKLVAFMNGFETGSEEYKERLTVRSVYNGSRLFRHGAHYCDDMYDEWYVLSAKWSVVKPGDVIRPYDVDIRSLTQAELSAWYINVSGVLGKLGLLEPNVVVFWHTTKRFSNMFEGLWEDNKQQYPLAKLTKEEQLAWYNSKGY